MIPRWAILTALLATSGWTAEVNVALLRFRSIEKAKMLAPVRLEAPPRLLKEQKANAILAALRSKGAAALIFQTTQLLRDEKPHSFERTDTASVVLPAESTKLPAMTRIALKFDLTCADAKNGLLSLSWNGTIKWSPELLDRSVVSALPGETNTFLLQPLNIFTDTAGFEYPVLKETAFQSSKLVKEGELAICTTAAESGGRPPEILVLCIWAFKE